MKEGYMAKKNEVVKSEVAKVSDLKVVSNMQIDKNDLVSVAVAKKERELLAEKTRLSKLVKERSTALNVKSKESNATVAKAFRSHVGEAVIADLQAKFVALGDKAIVMDNASLHEDTIHGVLCVGEKLNRNYGRVVLLEATIPIPTEVSDILANIAATQKELATFQSDLVKVHEGLGNLSRLERQVRAKFAEKVLSETVQGQALLDSILENDSLLLE